MALNIKPNTYKTPVEIREHAVQGICDAFLDGNVWSEFHPTAEGCYRHRTMYLVRHAGKQKYYGFRGTADLYRAETLKVNGAEIKEAVKALLEAGYFFWKDTRYPAWPAYRFTSTPVPPSEWCRRVVEISETID